MPPNSQKSQDTEIIIRMFKSAVRIPVNVTTWLWHSGCWKHHTTRVEDAQCELFPAPACTSWFYLDGKCAQSRFVICAIQIIMAWLVPGCHILKSLHMTHPSAGKQEALHLGEEVKRTPRLRTIPFLPKWCCYYSHLPGNTQTVV